MTQPDDLLTPTEAAVLLGVQPATLKQWVRRGKLKVAKEWGEGTNTRRLFSREEVERYGAERRPAHRPKASTEEER